MLMARSSVRAGVIVADQRGVDKGKGRRSHGPRLFVLPGVRTGDRGGTKLILFSGRRAVAAVTPGPQNTPDSQEHGSEPFTIPCPPAAPPDTGQGPSSD